LPITVTIDKSGANNAALERLKYLNIIVEQDHCSIKRVTKSMLGFESFAAVEATIAGIEVHHMLTKGQIIFGSNMPVW